MEGVCRRDLVKPRTFFLNGMYFSSATHTTLLRINVTKELSSVLSYDEIIVDRMKSSG